MSDETLYFGIFTAECWSVFVEGLDELFVRWDVISILKRLDYYKPCALKVVSKVLGYAIILGSFGYKVPQILAVVQSRSATGLSLAAMELDVFVFLAALGYSLRQDLPISAYGEQATVLFQNIILLLLARYYRGSFFDARFAAGVVALAASCAAIAALPETFLSALPLVTVAASVASRVPQLLANFQQGHTGQLSTITVALNVRLPSSLPPS